MKTPPPEAPRDSSQWLFLAALVIACFAAYCNSFRGPFVFDDLPAIRDNASIRSLTTAWAPPSAAGNTVGGRPLLNVSFALNYLCHGENIVGYHVVNFLIHGSATLLLFGVALRLCLASPESRLQNHASWFAFALAVLWATHPLQTESVTYIVQRAESFAAALSLLSLYGFARGSALTERRRSRWLALSVAACFAGAATKETVAVVPLLTLLFDRAFFAGSFTAAWRDRRAYYVAIMLSWIPVTYFVFTAQGRGASAGFGTEITPWTYLLTQCWAIPHYLLLTLWPQSQVFDYGSPVVTTITRVAPAALLLVGAVAMSVWGVWKNSRVAIVAFAFFLLLAPSSSIVPVATQTVAEHRMYLPLAAALALLILLVWRWTGKPGLVGAACLALITIPVTVARNAVYHTAESLWTDTVAKRPENPRAHNNLGLIYAESNRLDDAIFHFQRAVQLVARNPDAWNNLGRTLTRAERKAEAIAALEEAVRLAPESLPALLNLADVLAQSGRATDAITYYERAARIGALNTDALTNYGATLLHAGRPDEAIAALETAVTQEPHHARARYNLGNSYASKRNWPRAIENYRAALQADPTYVAAYANLGNALMLSHRFSEAAASYEAGLKLRPNDAILRANLSRAREFENR